MILILELTKKNKKYQKVSCLFPISCLIAVSVRAVEIDDVLGGGRYGGGHVKGIE